MKITTSENDIKERLSVAYLTAVAARAGCQVAKLDIDKESVDALIRPVSGPKNQVNLQLKSTTAQLVNDGLAGLSLPIKNYDDLRDTTGIVPHYLLVLQLPPDAAEWLAVSATELIMRGVAYYGNLHGLPAVLNTTSRVVTMPQSQRFDVDALTRMVLAAPERIGVVGG